MAWWSHHLRGLILRLLGGKATTKVCRSSLRKEATRSERTIAQTSEDGGKAAASPRTLNPPLCRLGRISTTNHHSLENPEGRLRTSWWQHDAGAPCQVVQIPPKQCPTTSTSAMAQRHQAGRAASAQFNHSALATPRKWKQAPARFSGSSEHKHEAFAPAASWPSPPPPPQQPNDHRPVSMRRTRTLVGGGRTKKTVRSIFTCRDYATAWLCPAGDEPDPDPEPSSDAAAAAGPCPSAQPVAGTAGAGAASCLAESGCGAPAAIASDAASSGPPCTGAQGAAG